MEQELIDLARKKEIRASEWNQLVQYFEGEAKLALAARIFLMKNPEAIEVFNYGKYGYVNNERTILVIAQYLAEAQKAVASLEESGDESIWFMAAQLPVLIGNYN